MCTEFAVLIWVKRLKKLKIFIRSTNILTKSFLGYVFGSLLFFPGIMLVYDEIAKLDEHFNAGISYNEKKYFNYLHDVGRRKTTKGNQKKLLRFSIVFRLSSLLF